MHVCDPVLNSDTNVRVQYAWDVYEHSLKVILVDISDRALIVCPRGQWARMYGTEALNLGGA